MKAFEVVRTGAVILWRGLIAAAMALSSASIGMAQQTPVPLLPPAPPSVSTIPSNGDVNPYGVAFVPRNFAAGGTLQPGDILVSNFNNSANLQGTGTTVVRAARNGDVSTFFQGKPGLGLTAALGVVRYGYVFVGNLPTTDGTSATVQPGSLLVLDRNGNLLGQIADSTVIDGPWGIAIHDSGDAAQVFISNVLNGTITRFDLGFSADGDQIFLTHAVRIASGFNHRLDPAALVLGPSGLSYDAKNDTLYVASSADNAVYAIRDGGTTTTNLATGKIIYQDNVHLHGPLNLVRAPNGDFLVANSDGSNVDPNQPSEIVEFTAQGKFVTQFSIDKTNGGAFGIGLAPLGNGAVRFAAVDDVTNTLNIWAVPVN